VCGRKREKQEKTRNRERESQKTRREVSNPHILGIPFLSLPKNLTLKTSESENTSTDERER